MLARPGDKHPCLGQGFLPSRLTLPGSRDPYGATRPTPHQPRYLGALEPLPYSPAGVGCRRSLSPEGSHPGQELLLEQQEELQLPQAPLTPAPQHHYTARRDSEASTLPLLTPWHNKAPGTRCLSPNLIAEPGPAQPDGRGADGLFKSFPFVLPQDTFKGKLLRSLFYFQSSRGIQHDSC